jgi:origin recognition complex subunit 1
MYNFFNWPGLRHSRLIVLAVANTMDLPERTLSNKVSSRLGLTRITFPGYTHDQLMKIIQSRLECVPGNVVDPDAVQFASRKVAAVSGDARRALDICRRAVELAEEAQARGSESTTPSTPSKKKPKAGGTSDPKKRASSGMVTIETVRRAINEATTSPLQQYLRALPFASKLLLAALVARIQRAGVGESTFGAVLEEMRRILKLATESRPLGLLNLKWASREPGDPQSRPRQDAQAPRPSGVGLAAVDLMDAGIINLEGQRVEGPSKIRLAVGDEEIRLAFRDDPEIKDLGMTL